MDNIVEVDQRALLVSSKIAFVFLHTRKTKNVYFEPEGQRVMGD